MKEFPYEDIIDLPYRKSLRHPPMTALKRAAQFSPFAALTGFGDIITRTALQAEDLEEGEEPELFGLSGDPWD